MMFRLKVECKSRAKSRLNFRSFLAIFFEFLRIIDRHYFFIRHVRSNQDKNSAQGVVPKQMFSLSSYSKMKRLPFHSLKRRCTSNANPNTAVQNDQKEESVSKISKDIVDFLSLRFFTPLEKTKISVDDWKKSTDLDVSLLNTNVDRLKLKTADLEKSLQKNLDNVIDMDGEIKDWQAITGELSLKVSDLKKNDLFVVNEKLELLEGSLGRLESQLFDNNCAILGQMNSLEYKMKSLEEKDITNNTRNYIDNQIERIVYFSLSKIREEFEVKLKTILAQRKIELLTDSNAELEKSIIFPSNE